MPSEEVTALMYCMWTVFSSVSRLWYSLSHNTTTTSAVRSYTARTS